MIRKTVNIFLLATAAMLFSLLNNAEAATGVKLGLPSGKISVVTTKIVNGRKYIHAGVVAKIVFDGATYSSSKSTISNEFHTLNFASSSFFISLEKGSTAKIAQMRMPALMIKKQHYFPLVSFMESLEILELFSTDILPGFIRLSVWDEVLTEAEGTDEEKLQTPQNLAAEPQTAMSQSGRKIYTQRVLPRIISGKKDDEIPISAEKTAEAYEEADNQRIDLYNNRQKRLRLFGGKSIAPKRAVPATRTRSFQPEGKSYPPNQYVIPRNLIRKEVKQTPQKKKRNDSLKSKPYSCSFPVNYQDSHFDNSCDYFSKNNRNIAPNIYASASPGLWAVAASLRFIKIKAVGKKKVTEIYLTSNQIIKDYQKADVKDNEIILRVPNASNSIKSFTKLNGLGIIEEIQTEKIRKYLIFKIKLRAKSERCVVKRNGPKELVCRIYHKPLPKSKRPKTQPKEKISDVVSKADTDKELMTAITKVVRNSELDCIVLDPGHGGKDAGAVGCDGTKEKDITLSLAKKLKALLNKSMPDTKIIMTRDDDRFIELYRRGKIANEAGGKLFISIHLNAARKKPHKANGFETFILRPGKNDDAVRVAELENASIKFEKSRKNYKKLTEEEIIVATMAQSAFVKFSEKFAAVLQKEIGKSTHMTDRGVKQAGFYVLIGASMPNVLFEAAFLSNKKEEKFAKSEIGQNKIAVGMAKAVLKYAEEYSKSVKK